MKDTARIPTDDLIPKNMCCNNTLWTPFASTNTYNLSFFPQTFEDWNDLPDSGCKPVYLPEVVSTELVYAHTQIIFQGNLYVDLTGYDVFALSCNYAGYP